VNVLPLHLLSLSERKQEKKSPNLLSLAMPLSPFYSYHNILGTDTKMGAGTMLSRTGKEFASGVWYPIELTSCRKYLIPNDEAEQERLVLELICYLSVLVKQYQIRYRSSRLSPPT